MLPNYFHIICKLKKKQQKNWQGKVHLSCQWFKTFCKTELPFLTRLPDCNSISPPHLVPLKQFKKTTAMWAVYWQFGNLKCIHLANSSTNWHLLITMATSFKKEDSNWQTSSCIYTIYFIRMNDKAKFKKNKPTSTKPSTLHKHILMCVCWVGPRVKRGVLLNPLNMEDGSVISSPWNVSVLTAPEFFKRSKTRQQLLQLA